MTRSAAMMLEAAGLNVLARDTLQVAKIHEDLAYRLSMPLRKARGRINRLKRGEEALA